MLGLIAWDTPDDAREFETGFTAYLERTMPSTFYIARRDRRVVYATRIPSERARAAIEKIAWTAFRVDK